MTKEEEAIEYLKEHINYFKEQIKFIEAVDCDYYDEEYELYKNRVKQFETVLNMLKENSEEKEKKDKIINLMAERIGWLCKSNGILLDKEHDENFTQEDIKQYFERKSEE